MSGIFHSLHGRFVVKSKVCVFSEFRDLCFVKNLTFYTLLFLTFSAIPKKFKLEIVERIFPIANTA